MGRLPKLVKYGSKLVLEIMPSVAATVIGGFLLAQMHYSRMPEPKPPQATVAPATDVPTVREDRAAMRDVLKARRENPETPEEVRPKIAAAPVSPPSIPASAPASVTPPLPTAMDSIAPNEPVERAAVAPRTAVATAAPPRREVELPRARPTTAESVYVPAPPPGLPPANSAAPIAAAPIAVAPIAAAPNVGAPNIAAPNVAQPTPLSPVVVSAAEPPQMPPAPPVHRGPVGAVFSTLSSIVGHAANATGDTVNWVIDLPGKAISAGGRVIGVNPPPPPPQSRPFS